MRKRKLLCLPITLMVLLIAASLYYVSAEENANVFSETEKTIIDSEGVAVDAAHFPDEIFRQYLSSNFDSDSDGYLSAEEMSCITELKTSGTQLDDVEDFTGIEYLSSLETIYFSYTRIESLDISKNIALKTLILDNVYAIKEIDLSKNVNLENLELDYVDIHNVDLTNNPKLKRVCIIRHDGFVPFMESLDLSQNPLLEELLLASSAEEVDIDLSNNPNLKKLSLSGNAELNYVDLSNNTLLEYISGSFWGDTFKLPNLPRLKELIIDRGTVSEIDLSNLPELQFFQADCPNVTELDFSNNPELKEIVFNNGSLEKIDISACTKLNRLECYNNKLEKLDLTNKNEMKYILCYNNRLQELDLTNKPNLKWVLAGENFLSNINISNSNEKVAIELDDNQYEIVINDDRMFNLETLPGNFDISKASGWSGGTVEGNILTVDDGVFVVTYDYDIGNGSTFNVTLNVREESEITIAIDSTNFPDENFRKKILEKEIDKNCDGQLTKIEIADVKEINISSDDIYSVAGIEYFTELTGLSCDAEIKEINLSNFTKLERLSIVSNQLSEIDLSNNEFLNNLRVNCALLTEIDLSNNPLLTELYANGCALTEINVRNNPLLKKLELNDCSLTKLDISTNEELDTLGCENNLLTNLDLSNNRKLKYLLCKGNKLTSLDLSNNDEIFTLSCSNNMLTELNLADKKEIFWLECANNLLTEIDVSNSRNIEVLICNNNKLETLKIGSKNYLDKIITNNNHLTDLDISGVTTNIIYEINTDNNRYKIQIDENNSFDLLSLPGGFDISKASNWIGGTVNGTTLTVDEGTEEIIYDYDIGRGKTAKFKLSLSPICDYTIYDINNDGEVNISDATVIQLYIANLNIDKRYKIELADVDNDGTVSISDVTAMQVAFANGYA